MSAVVMERPRAEAKIETVFLANEPALRGWLAKLRKRSPHFAHEPDPQLWIGLRVGGILLAALAHQTYQDGTVLVSAILCAPRKAGRVAVLALWRTMCETWKGRRIVFFVSTDNRKMLKALPIGAKLRAVMFDVTV